MQHQNDQFANASNDYFHTLNKHTFNLQKSQHEQQLIEVNKLIDELEKGQVDQTPFSVEAQFNYLQKMIKLNKKEISQLRSKLEQKESMITELSDLNVMRKKYEKLIDTDYQNGIQQKLSMIRGKVDDLKKKIKEINKDILSNQQQHAELIDQYSYQLKTLETYRLKNQKLRQQIQELKNQKKK